MKQRRITKEDPKPGREERVAARERLARDYEVRAGGMATYMCGAVKPLEFQKLWKCLNDPSALEELRRQQNVGSIEEMQQRLTFGGMCYTLNATNLRFEAFAAEHNLFAYPEEAVMLAGRGFLGSMATKEAYAGITTDEIVGLITAASLDLLVRPYCGEELFEICGMGADRGFWEGNVRQKTINVSTLSALLVAACGVPTMKHGSYGNTSPSGSTDCIEDLQVKTNQTDPSFITRHLTEAGFVFTDAGLVKTLHDASHATPMHETVNHVVGPMTLPVHPKTLVHKVMGINEKVHPATIAHAFKLLNANDVQRYGNVAVVAGLGKEAPGDLDVTGHIQEHVVLDELSPYGSAVAFLKNGRYAGTHLLLPEHFGVTVTEEEMRVGGTTDKDALKAKIFAKNREALAGTDEGLTKYLAMNAALGLYVATEASSDEALAEEEPPSEALLKACYKRCYAAIKEGRAQALLKKAVAVSEATARPPESQNVTVSPPGK